ncbi:hypothetical protein SCMU_19240 [Sinomonas cyclohexanicum]|uniref:CdiI immunity protein domain-containing protein n=1 Tax=Sinomonas cyclohexanicum TaxID=322009 RepID=A0ABN6FGR0_SINCY|nr:hypothetical protein [Corynebacterium cyclohexanicum]BCT76082.1 hypothetical protein SCMU_19240 [Corynebacterium cyclohexanicum]
MTEKPTWPLDDDTVDNARAYLEGLAIILDHLADGTVRPDDSQALVDELMAHDRGDLPWHAARYPSKVGNNWLDVVLNLRRLISDFPPLDPEDE